jgi:uncharacterized protein (DUF433 family)
MTLPDFLTQSADGEIRLANHRIGLYQLVQAYNEGESAEMLASRYPTLSLSLVHKTIAFYLDNRADVDAYIDECAKALEDLRRAGPVLDLSDLSQRLSSEPLPAA